jgi:hypothetical protein
MPPVDMTLINDSRLYMIGAGIVEINQKDPVTGLLTGYRDAGNASVVQPTNSDERFQKYESRTRFRALVADLLLRRNTSIEFSFDEWSSFLLGIWAQATVADLSSQAATPIVDEVVSSAVVPGDSYLLAKRGPISAVTVKGGVAGSTTMTLGTDYVIDDPNVGVIRTLASGTFALGDILKVSYTPTAYASTTGKHFDIGTISTVDAAIRFIGDPPNGPRLMWDWWVCSIRPNGALPLVTTANENTPLNMIATVKTDYANHPTNPIGQITELPA